MFYQTNLYNGQPQYDRVNIGSTRTDAYSNRPLPIKGSPPRASNYHRKLALMTSVSGTKLDRGNGVWSTSGDSRSWFSLAGHPHGSAYSSPDVSVPGWMSDKVIQECVLELNGNSANILEDLGQAVQTANMAADLLFGIWLAYKAFRQGKPKSAQAVMDELMSKYKGAPTKPAWQSPARKRAGGKRQKHRSPLNRYPKGSAQAWLVFFYGVMPLISTVEALLTSHQPKDRIFTATRKLSNPVDPMHFISVQNWITCRQNGGKSEQTILCSLTAAVKMGVDQVYTSSLGLTSPSGGIDPIDALVTAWALVPYSFVVDWFIPVERFLRSRTWSAGVIYRDGFITKRLTCNSTFTATYRGVPYSNWNSGGSWPSVLVRSIQVDRKAYLTAAPLSGLNLKVSLSSTQSISALALIVAKG